MRPGGFAATIRPHMPEPTTTSIACLEVWGGNEPIDTRLSVPGMDVFVFAVPYDNSAAGGDVHFVSSCGSGRIARLMIADVAGHGQIVAGMARTLRDLMRRFMNHIDQRKLVMQMNERFTELSDAGRFATAIVMTYYSPEGVLSLCNAGHPPPLLYRARTREWEFVDSVGAMPEGVSNIPLGILSDAGYEQFEIELEAGDLLLAYTDSLVEAQERDGNLLGADGLLKVARTLDGSQPEHLVHHLMVKLSVAGAKLADDTTVVLARSHGKSSGAGIARRLWADVRFIGQVLTFRRNIPWPEFSLANLGGMWLPWLSKRRRRQT
jgi:phosphoserine phosphatase RsbU/P